MSNACLLVVDDDPMISDLIGHALTLSGAGYNLSYAYDGLQGLREIERLRPDLVILDVKMPGMNGYSFLRSLRSAGHTMPVIVLTVMGEDSDQIEGFVSGCDDYIQKPFSPVLLSWRVRARLRKMEAHRPLRFADIEMDTSRHIVRRGSCELPLTPREFRLLECFLRHPEEALKRDFILDRVWEDDVDPNNVDVYVKYLRTKMEADGGPRLIHAVWGVGYTLRLPATDSASKEEKYA
jgi:two-component system, OmpR family, response regulator MprA